MTDLQARYLGEHDDAPRRSTVPDHIAALKDLLGPIKPRKGIGGKFVTEAQSMARARELSESSGWNARLATNANDEAKA